MDAQDRVRTFAAEHDMTAPPAYRVLDLVAEVGEIAADAAKTSEYGASPTAIDVADDEIGDALFSLLLVAESMDVDADAALETALQKYERRLADSGDAGSGSG